jgi:hypothetical protein
LNVEGKRREWVDERRRERTERKMETYRREKKMQRMREIVFYPFVMKLGIFCHLI